MWSAIMMLIFGFFMGLFAGVIIKDRAYERLYKSQQARGDYWFLRYIAASCIMQEHNLYLPNSSSNDDFYE